MRVYKGFGIFFERSILHKDTLFYIGKYDEKSEKIVMKKNNRMENKGNNKKKGSEPLFVQSIKKIVNFCYDTGTRHGRIYRSLTLLSHSKTSHTHSDPS